MLLSLWLTALLTLHTVVVEGRELDAGALSVAVASCDEALSGDCVAADSLSLEQRANAELYVVLRADAALTSVHADVLQRGSVVLSRTLSLELTASREERARAIGLVVAAQVLAMQSEVPAPVPVRVHSVQEARQAFRFDVAAQLGTALDRGPPRLGLVLRGSWLASRLPLGLLASLRGAYRPDAPRVGWAGASLGVLGRVPLPSESWALEGRLEAVGQRTEVGARYQGRRAHTGTLRWGGLLGLDVLWRITRRSWLFASLEGTLLGPRVDLYVRGRALGSEPALGLSGALGFRHGW